MEKNPKQNPLPGDGTSTAEAVAGRVGRDKQSEARRANTTPDGGPRLELEGLWLKPWTKSHLSTAEMI